MVAKFEWYPVLILGMGESVFFRETEVVRK
jgi:hypothetical protein